MKASVSPAGDGCPHANTSTAKPAAIAALRNLEPRPEPRDPGWISPFDGASNVGHVAGIPHPLRSAALSRVLDDRPR